jgi:superfamily II DNA/RNA helicase
VSIIDEDKAHYMPLLLFFSATLPFDCKLIQQLFCEYKKVKKKERKKNRENVLQIFYIEALQLFE